jgi:hypothetical protein
MAIGSTIDRISSIFSPELMNEINDGSTRDTETFAPLWGMISKFPGKDHPTENVHRQHDISGRGAVSGIAVREGTEDPTPFRVTPNVLDIRYNIPFVKARGTVTPRDNLNEALENTKNPNAVRHLFMERYKEVLKTSLEMTSRQFTRGSLTLRGDISATDDAEFITAISQFSTLWGYSAAGYTAPEPMGASHGFFEFRAPASQTNTWQSVTRTGTSNRYYHQHVDLSGPESFAAGFRAMIMSFHQSGPPRGVKLGTVVLADNQTILDYATFSESRRIIVANQPNDAENTELGMDGSTLEFKYPTKMNGITFDVYSTPDLDYTQDTDIRTLQGVMMGIDPSQWRRDTCNAALQKITGMFGETFGTSLHTRAPYNPVAAHPGVWNLDTTFGWQFALVGSPLGHWSAKGSAVTTT